MADVLAAFGDSLVRNVDLLCLDAGNTVVFFDHERVARLCATAGFATTAEALERAEGKAKRAHEHGPLAHIDWTPPPIGSARTWGAYVGAMLLGAGIDAAGLPALLDELWVSHRQLNLWSLPPPGIAAALAGARATGLHVAIVSNSEGQLEAFLDRVGLRRSVDAVIDSGVVGVEKPDPKIFRVALERFGVDPSRALHLGDIVAIDVVGARASGMRAALVDPYDHFGGLHLDVPRVAGVREVASAIASARAGPR
ncbi:MAG: HAD family hydrolase [Polyangiaceae bacterium]